MQHVLPATTVLEEHAGYIAVPGAHLYAMLHRAARPEARVLLVGPFASERQFAYHAWARWARYLAARGIEVLRFDHRGTGESTGDFESASFEQWCADTQALADWLARQSPELPLLIHGVELGAVLAGRCFSGGAGDALLLWSPPANANQAMRAVLRRWAGMEQLYESPENRKSASEYIRELESGSSIEVHGYVWRSSLWRESFTFGIPDGMRDEVAVLNDESRPVKVDRCGSKGETLAMPYRRYDGDQDLSSLYFSTYTWVACALRLETHGADGTRN
jgi:pimeloyl-ACP methyl ester carboxylesterase